MKKKSRTLKSRNYLPETVGQGFEKDLRILIDGLTSDQTFRSSYLRDEAFSKFMDESLVSADERATNAISKWRSVEDNNRKTNMRIFEEEDTDLGWATVDEILSFAAERIASVLGPFSSFWDRESGLINGSLMGNHTNGASTRVKRSEIAAVLKHSGQAHVTVSALPYWKVLSSGTILEDQELAVVDGSVLFTVPKKTDIDRVACKEPEINMFLQRIAGGHIRHSLRKVGIDLNDQSINQRYAKEAYHEGLATVDLSSASDSITHQLVLRLLPWDWYEYLDDVRVKETRIHGERHELEMFSSMGNGFTFELESLLFWALTHAVKRYSGIPGPVSVYGDDIICPSSVVPRLARFFSWVGFTVNLKKSHWRGAFRESCGKHYYYGNDVTPFYIRRKVSLMTDLIKTLNQLMVWGSEGSFIIYDEVLAFHRKWANIVPRSIWGGVDPSDTGALVTGHTPRKRIVPRTQGYRSNSVSVWHQSKSDVSYSEAGLHCWLTNTSSRQGDSLNDNTFDTSSSRHGGFRLSGYPSGQEHTTWTPWYMALPSVTDT